VAAAGLVYTAEQLFWPRRPGVVAGG
jgi:hypothetical protein